MHLLHHFQLRLYTSELLAEYSVVWLVFPHELDGLSAEEVAEGKPVIADLVQAATRMIET